MILKDTYKVKNSWKYQMWAHNCLLVVLLLSVGCSAPQTAQKDKDAAQHEVSHRTLSYEQQRRFNDLYLEAVRQREKNNYDASYDLLTGALELNPDASEAVFDMALLKIAQGGAFDTTLVNEGDSLLRRAVDLAPANRFYKETLANELIRRADFKGATQLYEELAAVEPSEETLGTLMKLYEQTGNFQGAIQTINRLEDIVGPNEDLALEKFQMYISQKDDDHAYKTIEDLCAEYPNELKYRVLLGDLYFQNGHPEQAAMVYRDVLTSEPDNAFAQISMLAYYNQTHQDSLYQQMVREVVLNPQTQSDAKVEAMRGYIGTTTQKGDSLAALPLFREALDQPQADRSLAELCAYYVAALDMPVDSLAPIMNKILEVEPDYKQARLQLLQIAINHQNQKEVLRLCREGINYSPSEIVFYYYEGATLLQQDRTEEALKVLYEGISRIDNESDKETASDMLSMLADIEHEKGRHEKAFSLYKQAADLNPNNLLCLNNYAYFLSLERRNLDQAEAMSRKTVDAEPQNSTYLDTYAWILYQNRRYQQARIYIDQTLKHTPNDEVSATLYLHAGDIYYRCGDRRSALAFWRKALNVSSDKKQRAQLRRKIQRRRL